MAISISGSPQTLSAGYNPMYFYASSTNINEPNFRYLVDVYNLDTNTQLAGLKIKPRFGDDLLEVNINKILQSNLGSIIDDIDVNGVAPSNGINNTDSSGFKYKVDLGEEYTDNWAFGGILTGSTGDLQLISTSALPANYNVGDVIYVTGAADELEYTGITMSTSGNTRLLLTGVHTFLTGDIVSVYQDSPYQYPLYNGSFTVTSESTSTTLVISLQFQGASTLPQSGDVIRNGYFNGAAIVISAYTSGGFFYIELDKPVVSQDWTQIKAGETRYADSRVSSFPNLTNQTKSVFNGAVSYKDWLTWPYTDYYNTSTNKLFLTTLPDSWIVREDNDVFLNLWVNGLSTVNNFINLKTYDCSGGLITNMTIPNSLSTNSMIQTFSAGPDALNNINTTPVSVITNGDFSSTADWILNDFNGGVSNITGGTLNYIDYSSSGSSLVAQSGVLMSGVTYTVTLDILSNSGVTINVGDQFNLYPISVSGETGSVTLLFTATGTDFFISIVSSGATPNSLVINNASVFYPAASGGTIDCNTVCYYTIQVLNNLGNPRSELRTFVLDCSCEYKYINYPVLFMDRMGSYVPFNFSLNNKQKVDIKRETFNRFVGDLSVGSTNGYNYSLAESGNRTYSVLLEEEWEINTNWLTEAESLYMEQLITSPNVLIKIDGDYYAVNVIDSSYERIRKNNQKMIQYKLRIAFANNNTIQTG